jgi:hypothetical protein
MEIWLPLGREAVTSIPVRIFLAMSATHLKPYVYRSMSQPSTVRIAHGWTVLHLRYCFSLTSVQGEIAFQPLVCKSPM